MKKHSFFVPFLFFVILATFAPTETLAKDEWIKVRSKNFYLIGNAADKDIRRVATRLEQFRVVFNALFPGMKFSSPIPTTVIVFKNDKVFKPYKPVNESGKATEWVAGYFQPSEDINYITLTTEGERNETFRTIFHEYIHFLVDNTMGRTNVPPWFNEGLAEYYERFIIENDQKVTLGDPNWDSLARLRSSQLIPLETLFNINYPTLHQQGKHGAGVFYAQSWALIHYLVQGGKGSKNSQLGQFLDLMIKGVNTRDAFNQAFKMDFPVMEAEFRKYIGQASLTASVFTFNQKLLFEADIHSSPMTEAEAKANLGDLLSHSRRLDDAEAHLLEALALDGESVMANSSMGYVKMRQRKFDEAKKYLEKAATADQQNFMVHYRYAYTLNREFTNEYNQISRYSDDTAVKMREALTKAISLNPGFPESYGLMAMISLVRNERTDEGIANLKKAINLAPGNQHYHLNLATIYMNQEQWDNAQPILEGVIRTAEDAGMRAHAQMMLGNLHEVKEQMARFKSQGGGGRFRRGPMVINMEGKQPTEEELKKLQDQAEREGILGALREPQSGEERITGHLTRIECAAGTITYTIRTDTGVIRLHSKDFQGLNIMAYGPVVETEIGCGSVKKEFYAILTYVPKENGKAKTRGELTSIEIVPDNFKL